MKRPNPASVLKVGDGRGFIFVSRAKFPPVTRRLKPVERACFMEERVVVTASHCLPQLPQGYGVGYSSERTYKALLASLDGSKSGVSAECLFADPVSDIAVLGCPDASEVGAEAVAYNELTDNAPFLQMAKARSGPGWVLSLDGKWIRMTLEVSSSFGRASLWTGPTDPGMSGSPILNKRER